ncbi:hypothetical protein RDI58_001202 [Solanum bulbocastanum]|uniref:Uncharacterized protein n=1 Tax=Solanum bulbocastanum TaxID=147425 RepID=A0AAN8U937_SOLBU
MCSQTAEHMRWHASESNLDGLMRHPKYGEARKTFDRIHFGFSYDPRNVRLSLAIDGFNPFGTMSSTYSIWPVLLISYNLPPWMCILYGWNTHTAFACPTCNFDTEPCRLRHGKKWCLMGHRRFLRRNHRFRLSRICFNGSALERNPPLKLLGSDILRQIAEERRVELDGRRKRFRRTTKRWNKRSIFFELPYWESNLLRQNLYFMHIEKNICENIIYTLLDDKSKSKDNANAGKDLREMKIWPDLWLKDDGSYNLAVFSLMTDIKMKKKISGLKSHDSHVLLE